MSDEFDIKELSGKELPTESREEWVKENLWWDQDKKMWWIPGSSYDSFKPGSITHANHLALMRMFPWLEEDGHEGDWGLYLDPESIDWMPLWNPFKKACAQADNFNVIDPDTMEEVNWVAIQKTWKDREAALVWKQLADRFGGQFRSPNWQKELENFLLSDKGLKWFDSRAGDIEEYWDTDVTPPSMDVQKVADSIDFEDLIAQVYPQKDQPELLPPEPDSQLKMFEGIGDEEEMSDFMRDVRQKDPASIKEFLNEHFPFDEVNQVWELDSFSNFGGSLINRANAKYFQDKYPGLVTTEYGGHDSETVGIKVADLNKIDAAVVDSLYDDIGAIKANTIIDENLYWHMEQELRQEAWDGWIKRDFRDTLILHFPQYRQAFEKREDDENFRALFEDARDRAGEEWIEEQDSGGKQYAHVGAVASAVTEELIRQWLAGGIAEMESLDESERAKYSVVMAPAPPDLADAVIRWGKMFITDDKLYIDDKAPEDFGREGDVHVTVKFGLHEQHPSDELLKIIEQTQPFEIEIGPISLFKNEKFDVVKFGVGGNSLRALNARVSQLKNSDSHPEYNPHMTVAYVQKGTCDHLVGKPLFDDQEPGAIRFLVKAVTFRGAEKRKISLFLGKPNVELVT